MSQVRCKIDDLGKVISDILDEFGEDIYKGVQEAVPRVAKIAQQEAKAASPARKKDGKKGRKKGRYKRGWAIKEERRTQLRTDYIVHNRTDYQLTHLLEKGHVLKKGGRTAGSTRAITHIAPAEEHAIKNFEEAIVKIAEGRGS